MSDDAALARLLEQYVQYKLLSRQQAIAAHTLARAKLAGTSLEAAQQAYDTVTASLQALSDAMTFASPVIWMRYKYTAYQDEQQPIRTMHAFRQHCDKPGYVCTKRYMFVNHVLQPYGRPPLSDRSGFADDRSLETVWPELVALVSDEACMETWRAYEYQIIDGRVAKWHGYSE